MKNENIFCRFWIIPGVPPDKTLTGIMRFMEYDTGEVARDKKNKN